MLVSTFFGFDVPEVSAFSVDKSIHRPLLRTQLGLQRSKTAANSLLSGRTSFHRYEATPKSLSASLSKRSFPRTTSTTCLFSVKDESADTKRSTTDSTTPSPLRLDPADAPPFTVTLESPDGNYSYRDAIVRTLGWVGAACTFGGVVWATMGSESGAEFFAGYLIEQSLSVDNLFVFLLLFEYFKVPLAFQDRVLNWGIYGAIVMRGIMIGLGAAALEQYHGILLVFAAILVYGSGKFFWGLVTNDEDDEVEEDPGENTIVRFARSVFPSTEEYDGDRFFTQVDGIRKATPLFVCMVAVEISDVVFAVDSIPAVFGVTEDPIIVFTSNLFAIMGLRSLYTILSKAATDLKYLEPEVALVLGFIGCKMIAEYFGYVIPTNVALLVVGSLLGTGVGASVYDKQQRLNTNEEKT
jgi:TerC family integral membrane protein